MYQFLAGIEWYGHGICKNWSEKLTPVFYAPPSSGPCVTGFRVASQDIVPSCQRISIHGRELVYVVLSVLLAAAMLSMLIFSFAFVQKCPNCDCDTGSILGDLINRTGEKRMREYFAWTEKMGFKRLHCSNCCSSHFLFITC